jgi:hypothetical protein
MQALSTRFVYKTPPQTFTIFALNHTQRTTSPSTKTQIACVFFAIRRLSSLSQVLLLHTTKATAGLGQVLLSRFEQTRAHQMIFSRSEAVRQNSFCSCLKSQQLVPSVPLICAYPKLLVSITNHHQHTKHRPSLAFMLFETTRLATNER